MHHLNAANDSAASGRLIAISSPTKSKPPLAPGHPPPEGSPFAPSAEGRAVDGFGSAGDEDGDGAGIADVVGVGVGVGSEVGVDDGVVSDSTVMMPFIESGWSVHR
jgi:hypothetical protein